LSPVLITSNLKTQFMGQKVIYNARLTSTMDVARQKAHQGAVEGTIIVAEEQTVGRGRLKRTWISPGGNIFLSVILYPGIDILPSLIMITSVAVVRSIETVTGLKAQIKWPNDILINGKKTAGILVENSVKGNEVEYAVIGIGINVNLRASDFIDILPDATSLYNELGREVPRLGLVQQLLVEMEGLYQALLSGGSIFEEWRNRLVTLGKKVQVRWGETIQEGIAEAVAQDGSLLLRNFDGNLIRIVAGDATLSI